MFHMPVFLQPFLLHRCFPAPLKLTIKLCSGCRNQVDPFHCYLDEIAKFKRTSMKAMKRRESDTNASSCLRGNRMDLWLRETHETASEAANRVEQQDSRAGFQVHMVNRSTQQEQPS